MNPVIPRSISNVSLFHGASIASKSYNVSAQCNSPRKPRKQFASSRNFVLPISTSMRLIPNYRCPYLLQNPRGNRIAAMETEVAVEEQDTPVAEQDKPVAEQNTPAAEQESDKKSEAQSDLIEGSENSSTSSYPGPAQSRKTKPGRKSEMPPVKNDELVPGATFTGRVRAIQPFGAFVDFGAFTDGLVHVSRLSDSFVKDVSSVVSIGQEVKVRLVEANIEAGRISLTMRESDESPKRQPLKAKKKNTPKPNQKREDVKSTKFVKGQELQGTVKNLIRSGAFISLPDGEEGFLPTSEEADDGLGSMMGASTLQAGQEVSVRVLRVSRGQVTLTMKKEVDNEKYDTTISEGVVHTATNPFVLAFRKNKDIAMFLDEREEAAKKETSSLTPSSVETLEKEKEGQNESEEAEKGAIEETATPVAGSVEIVEEEKEDQNEKDAEEAAKEENATLTTSSVETVAEKKEDQKGRDEPQIAAREGTEDITASLVGTVEVETENQNDQEEAEEVAKEESATLTTSLVETDEKEKEDQNEQDEAEKAAKAGTEALEASSVESVEEKREESEREDAENADKEETATVMASMVETLEEEKEDNAEILASESSEIAGVEAEGKVIVKDSSETLSESDQAAGIVHDNKGTVKDELKAESSVAPAESEENGSVNPSEAKSYVPSQEEAGDEVKSNGNGNTVPSPDLAGPQLSSSESNAVEKVQASATTTNSSPHPSGKASISPALVKQLREETGAGMMDCKKALAESGGDLVKAQEHLRKKGLATAETKASRATAEGRIGSYIHDSRIGVLLEVNCETDFVSRGEIFKELVDDLAMQVAAYPQVEYLVTEDVPEEIVRKEKEIEIQKEDLLSKPEQIREKIVEGRIRKRLEELALLEQAYIRNDKVLVKDWVKQTIATVGENIKVKRFVRFNLGEGLEKKSQDFAAEVAAQTAAKRSTEPKKDQPEATEAKEAVERPMAVTISAALVKQLRKETGAGMMDCKKALSETGGDLEKAQEYLRKKGLASADKKSSRLAAEGRIGSYIHDSRIGVLIEVNCETDFVGRSEKFKELVDDLAMQVVACPQVQFVSVDEIPEGIVMKEKEIEMQREDILSKPENIRERIVEGRISKRLGELALLEQPYIKDDSLLVKDLVKQTIAALGENIKVRRFVRFTLGEVTESDAKGEA